MTWFLLAPWCLGLLAGLPLRFPGEQRREEPTPEPSDLENHP